MLHRMPRWPVSMGGLLVGCVVFAFSGTPVDGQSSKANHEQDQDFTRQVKHWTTKPEFSSPLVDHLPCLCDSSETVTQYLGGLMDDADQTSDRPAIVDVTRWAGANAAVCDQPVLSMAEPR